MFSALVLVQQGVPASPSSEAIVRTLSALVPAAVEGLVRDVTLASLSHSDDLARIADHAGCEYVHAPAETLVGAAVASLKQPRILALRGGRSPAQGFIGELADLAAYRSQQCALMLDTPDSLLTRLVPRLSRASGVVAPRETLKQAKPDISVMAKALPSPLVMKVRMIGES